MIVFLAKNEDGDFKLLKGDGSYKIGKKMSYTCFSEDLVSNKLRGKLIRHSETLSIAVYECNIEECEDDFSDFKLVSFNPVFSKL